MTQLPFYLVIKLFISFFSLPNCLHLLPLLLHYPFSTQAITICISPLPLYYSSLLNRHSLRSSRIDFSRFSRLSSGYFYNNNLFIFFLLGLLVTQPFYFYFCTTVGCMLLCTVYICMFLTALLFNRNFFKGKSYVFCFIC